MVWTIPAHVSDSARVRVFAPVDAEGALLPGPHPPVVFLHGGFVAPDRYDWWAIHVASRGYVVALPDHPARLAIAAQGHALEALEALRRQAGRPGPLAGVVGPEAPAAVAGHSLGGVAATRAWLGAPQDFATLAIVASFPAPWDDVAGRPDAPALSIVGENDGSADLSRVREGFEALAGPRLYAEVEGLNHYDWADGVTEGELDGDGPRGRPVPEARADAMAVMDTWLDAWLLDDPQARAAWATADFPGIEEGR